MRAWSNTELKNISSVAKGGFSPQRLIRIMHEFINGYKFIHQYKKAATIFGSARKGFDPRLYAQAERLGFLLAKEDFAVITGGGPGIMQAANKGAMSAGGKSLGLNIQLPKEQRTNPYVTKSIGFHYFFTRKVMMASASQVYVFFPGGFGTMDEFFEMLTLIQTKKVSPIVIILMNKEFWSPLVGWIEQTVYKKNRAIGADDLKLFHLVDDPDQAIELVRKASKKKIIRSGSRHGDTLEHSKRNS
ncbi:MAG: hypothetical protein JWO40_333 [Candidatus Doudnabacteria bacterium]|nr:hypothetical protein [Candidatus Doudnabacteria bacterium]